MILSITVNLLGCSLIGIVFIWFSILLKTKPLTKYFVEKNQYKFIKSLYNIESFSFSFSSIIIFFVYIKLLNSKLNVSLKFSSLFSLFLLIFLLISNEIDEIFLKSIIWSISPYLKSTILLANFFKPFLLFSMLLKNSSVSLIENEKVLGNKILNLIFLWFNNAQYSNKFLRYSVNNLSSYVSTILSSIIKKTSSFKLSLEVFDKKHFKNFIYISYITFYFYINFC
ncbi:Hypothetical protein MCYN_0329 [Mycoplasmopsis cynos C142]|uniref:Uncharacterized protein n=1 Tax=Mycoplasmopsis cynos (strain C142) TaxID=1246955 RepID=L0RWU6_MYCC1|nr:Hypothetical protein MCYN_0329 [Mycoplasmopsis cynos C142]